MSIIPVPLSGDPDTVASWGARYNNAAANLKRAADELRDLTDDSTFISLAVDEIRLKSLDARAATEKVSVRYSGAGAALAQYAVDLRDAQNKANAAISHLYGNDSELNAANRHHDDLDDRVKSDNGQTPDLVQQLLAAKRNVDRLVQQTAAAMSQYYTAEEEKREAAARAAQALGEAADDSQLNDNFFEAIGGYFQGQYEWAQKYLAPVIQAIYEALQEVSKILNVIALIVTVLSCFIPVLAPLAGILDAVALGVSAAILLCSLVLFVLGTNSLGQLAGDTLSFAVSLFTAGAGAGVKEAMGAATPAVLAAENGAAATSGFLATAGKQALWVLDNGATTVQVTSALAEATYGSTEIAIDGAIDEAKENSDPGIRIPWGVNAAGADWNAPPTIQVAALPPMPSYSMPEIVNGPVVEYASSSLSGGISVCSAGAA